ncbi:glycoside hydrolase family 10 protein [Leptolyngbya ohadii]|uniref:glycoside hydrolase family 10 protein n=1 Tax=Leptolyngbya ohadii TaxID=1962290 RepID=UPI000B59D4B1|nr:family 10 glycosylhydrolase [Leptolyngbya ohadii]
MSAPVPQKPARQLRLQKRRLFSLFFCALCLVFLLRQAPIVPQGARTSDEVRGVWMTDVGAALLYYTTRLDDTIAHLAKLQLNTLYPSVWNGGVTLHPSAVAGRAGGMLPLWQKLPRPDPLAGLVKQANRQKLRLIPWFEYGLMVPPRSAIALLHPDWLTTTRNGDQTDEANGQAWLNPAHPEAERFLVDLIVEVAQRYPIDGIQLDDHFGLPVAFGYDAYTVQCYRSEHGGKVPPADPTDEEWMKWRAAHITELMKKIARSVRAVRPSATISLSPNLPTFAYQNYLQDWTKWRELGLLDEVVVQVYRAKASDFAAELANAKLQQLRSGESTAKGKAGIPIAIGIYTGPFLKPKSIQQIQQQVDFVHRENYAGVSFFCWETTFWQLIRPTEEGELHLAQTQRDWDKSP